MCWIITFKASIVVTCHHGGISHYIRVNYWLLYTRYSMVGTVGAGNPHLGLTKLPLELVKVTPLSILYSTLQKPGLDQK
jgi:hypothetical protein